MLLGNGLRALPMFSAIWQPSSYHPHFTYKETEAQRSQVTWVQTQACLSSMLVLVIVQPFLCCILQNTGQTQPTCQRIPCAPWCYLWALETWWHLISEAMARTWHYLFQLPLAEAFPFHSSTARCSLAQNLLYPCGSKSHAAFSLALPAACVTVPDGHVCKTQWPLRECTNYWVKNQKSMWPGVLTALDLVSSTLRWGLNEDKACSPV